MKILKRKLTILIILTISIINSINIYANNEVPYVKSVEEFINLSKKSLINREEEISYKISVETYKLLVEKSSNLKFGLLGLTLIDDDKKIHVDSDYLEHNIKYLKSTWVGDGQSYTIKFNTVYYTNKEEEDQLQKEIKKAIKSLKLSKDSDYQKVKKIHDYIVNHVSYDETYSKYTAYDTLINKSAVCQGYALLAYRMFLQAGIKAKYISGLSKGQAHAWNIVNVDGKWYNIDLTWDDPITPDRSQYTSYDYFLKNDKDFKDHLRDQEYLSKQFKKAYPIAKKSY